MVAANKVGQTLAQVKLAVEDELASRLYVWVSDREGVGFERRSRRHLD